jgi:hypothetical protein
MDYLYETLPERPVVPDGLKEKILAHLKNNPNLFYTAKQLCAVTGFQETDPTKPTIRLACKELLHFNAEPVVSSHAGFAFATNKNLVLFFKKNLEARLEGLRRTITDVENVISRSSLSVEEPARTELCMGVYPQHLWDKNKDPWVCIRCGATRRKAA